MGRIKGYKVKRAATIYDYRRLKTLGDILASFEGKDLDTALEEIAKAWSIKIAATKLDGQWQMDTIATIKKLARHCLQAGRENYINSPEESED